MHPILITGAALASVPIILHLIMKQEPKTVRFPAFRLLQVKQKSNQRNIRLRHLLLMLLRILIISIMAFVLFQPSIESSQFSLSAEQPVAAVIVLDTSPSMGYVVADRSALDNARKQARNRLGESNLESGDWTVFDDARARAIELIDELPEGSLVALIETSDPQPVIEWPLNIAEVRNKIIQRKQPFGSTGDISAGLEQAYRLLTTVDSKNAEPGSARYPKFVCVLSDRTRASWQPTSMDGLNESFNGIPDPKPSQLWIDVGKKNDQGQSIAENLAILSADIEPREVLLPGQTPILRARVRYQNVASYRDQTKPSKEITVACMLDGGKWVDRENLILIHDDEATVTFRLPNNLSPGLHQVELQLEKTVPGPRDRPLEVGVSVDALPFDNNRFAAFSIVEGINVLILADDIEDARYWANALNTCRYYKADLKSPTDAFAFRPDDWQRYPVVYLFGVKDPRNLWRPLDMYVRSGGRLIVMPLDDDLELKSYNEDELAKQLMPARLVKTINVAENGGLRWIDWGNFDFQIGFLKPFEKWKDQDNPKADFVASPPVVYRYWQVVPYPQAKVIIPYANMEGHAAILERKVQPGSGQVMLFTTGFNGARDPNGTLVWNSYPETSIFLVLADLSAGGFVSGANDGESYNFPVGSSIRRKPARGDDGQAGSYVLVGPGIDGSDAIIPRNRDRTGLDIDRRRTGTPGNFVLKNEKLGYRTGYSLNVPKEESNLAIVEDADLEKAVGEKNVVPLGKGVRLRDILQSRFAGPVDLFPWLLILLLLIFAAEGVLANKFYRERPKRIR